STTPFTTFQWPLSPSGTFQPLKSFPLKSETKPAEPEGAADSDAQDTSPARNSPSVRRFMVILPKDPAARSPADSALRRRSGQYSYASARLPILGQFFRFRVVRFQMSGSWRRD